MQETVALQWTYALGDWVSHNPEAGAMGAGVIVWREYRETPWSTREQYGVIGLHALDLDLHESKLDIDVYEVTDLRPYDDVPHTDEDDDG